MKRNLLAVAAGLGLLASLPASAGLIIDTSGPNALAGNIGDFGAAGDGNDERDNKVVIDLFGNGTQLGGWFGANLYTDSDTGIKVEYLGKEAGYTNYFTISNTAGTQTCTLNNKQAVGTSCSVATVLAGLVNFSFDVDAYPVGPVGTPSVDRDVANGANNDSTVKFLADFWMGWDPNNAGSVLIALDDGGASPDDDNHDDFVLRISAYSVPEPASVALLGLGVLGLGLARRKA